MTLEVAVRHAFPGLVLDASFRLERPGVTALFGPSGAGKTSLVNAVAGTLRPQAGRIVIGGRVVFDADAGIFVPPEDRHVGYVFQDARLFPHMTVEGNLRFGWRRARDRASEQEIAHVVDLLGLGPLLRRAPRALSGGEKSRLALGRALLSAPAILLLDEPLAALDAARRTEILPYLERLRDELRVPMLYVSHALDEVARIADNIVILREGKVLANGTVFDVLTALDLENIAGAPPLGAVLPATIAGHGQNGLTELSFSGGRLFVPRLTGDIGTAIRVRIAAEEIMLAREELRAISANNVLPATIVAMRENAGRSDVQLRCGSARLVARITTASAERLALAPGMQVFAIVKSVTVDAAAARGLP